MSAADTSAVFREAYNAQKPPVSDMVITLTDEAMETAKVLREFLHLTTHGSLKSSFPRKCEGLSELVGFLDKWDCEHVRNTFWSLFENNVRGGEIEIMSGFLLAARFRNDRLCAVILDVFCEADWEKPEEEEESPLIHGGNAEIIWDANQWPEWVWTSGVPPRYLFAVARAFGWATTQDVDAGLKNLAQHFLHYLNPN